MINSNLNGNIPCGSQVQNNDRRLDTIEDELRGFKNQFGTVQLDVTHADIGSLDVGKTKANAIETVSIKAQNVNTENLDITGPVVTHNLSVTDNFSAADGNIVNFTFHDAKGDNVQTKTATIDNLIVGQIKSKDNNTLVNDLTVNGTAAVQKLVLGDPNVGPAIIADNVNAKTITSDKASLKEVISDSTDTEVLKCEKIIKDDTVQTNLLKVLGPNEMQVGDFENRVVLGCGSRPSWNDKPIATLDDLGDKTVIAYKGRLATETELVNIVNPARGDYYIITLLTKGEDPNIRTGIGFALYNGTSFDTDFFYELSGYRSAEDQDKVDDAQDTAIANEIARAKAKENELYEAGTKKLIEKNINTVETPELDKMYGSAYWGNVYTGIASEWKGESTLPIGAEAAGFCVEILANKHNTIQRYTTNATSGPKVWMRNYGNNVWSAWKEVAFTDSKVEDSLKLEGKTLTELRQLLFDDSHPVNDTFVSNDGSDDPNTIYNKNGIISVWTYIGQSFGIHGWKRTK